MENSVIPILTVLCFCHFFSVCSGQGIEPPSEDCDTNSLTCCFEHQFVRCERTTCDNNTCEWALSLPRPCAYLQTIITWCDCEYGFYKNSIGQCVTRDQCLRELKYPPKIPEDPTCKGEHMVLYGFLQPKDYRVCPSRPLSTSSSSSSTSCSTSSSSSHRHSSENNQFLPFIESHQDSSLYLMNVCNCVPPYYRNRCGKCVEYCECYKRCHGIQCPGPNEEERGGECVCIKPYRRNECGQCVRKAQLGDCCLCSNPCPGPNMQLRKFNEQTQRTCTNLQNPPLQGPFTDQYGCDCMEGYCSNWDGTCVENGSI